jgi:hypothetical protein
MKVRDFELGSEVQLAHLEVFHLHDLPLAKRFSGRDSPRTMVQVRFLMIFGRYGEVGEIGSWCVHNLREIKAHPSPRIRLRTAHFPRATSYARGQC